MSWFLQLNWIFDVSICYLHLRAVLVSDPYLISRRNWSSFHTHVTSWSRLWVGNAPFCLSSITNLAYENDKDHKPFQSLIINPWYFLSWQRFQNRRHLHPSLFNWCAEGQLEAMIERRFLRACLELIVSARSNLAEDDACARILNSRSRSREFLLTFFVALKESPGEQCGNGRVLRHRNADYLNTRINAVASSVEATARPAERSKSSLSITTARANYNSIMHLY